MLFYSEYCEIVSYIFCKIFGISHFSSSIKFKKSVSFLLFILSLVILSMTTSLVILYMDSEEYETFKGDIEGLICSVFYIANASIILIYGYLKEKYNYKIDEKITQTEAITKKLKVEAGLIHNIEENNSMFKKCLKLISNYIFILSRIFFINFAVWFQTDLDVLYVVNHSLMIIIMFCYHYENTVKKIEKRFEVLNQLVDHFKHKNGGMRYINRIKLDDFFWSVGKCYDNLHESSQMINKRFGACIFLTIFSSLIIITYAVFNFFMELMRTRDMHTIIGKIIKIMHKYSR
jgi:hypothetical protein